jgi:Flp pilus assembly protein CpaB
MATTPSVMAREAGTSAPTVKSARYRPSLSHIAIALAAVLAFVVNYLALQNRDATELVAIADSPIAEGVPLTSDLVRLVPLPADFEGLEHLVSEDDFGNLEGWIVGRSVAAGELLDRSAVIQPGAGEGLRTMSIPVPVEHAVGATLVVGDRVDVISMVGDEPVFVATDLEVVSIPDTTQNGLSGVGPYHVVVAVRPEDALALARAIAEGSIEILRSTGVGGIDEGEG